MQYCDYFTQSGKAELPGFVVFVDASLFQQVINTLIDDTKIDYLELKHRVRLRKIKS